MIKLNSQDRIWVEMNGKKQEFTFEEMANLVNDEIWKRRKHYLYLLSFAILLNLIAISLSFSNRC